MGASGSGVRVTADPAPAAPLGVGALGSTTGGTALRSAGDCTRPVDRLGAPDASDLLLVGVTTPAAVAAAWVT